MGRQLNLNPLDAALVASNAALFAFYKSIERTIDVTFREPLVPKTTRPIIYITWHRQNYVATPVFRKLGRTDRPTFIAHDGVASRAFSHHAPRWLGFEVFAFQRRGRGSPRDQIIGDSAIIVPRMSRRMKLAAVAAGTAVALAMSCAADDSTYGNDGGPLPTDAGDAG